MHREQRCLPHPHPWTDLRHERGGGWQKRKTDTDCTCTCAVVIHHSDRSPLEEVHQVQDGSAEGGEVGVQADIVGVPVVGHLMLPLGLDVGDPQSVADGLDRVGRRAVRGAENGCDPEGELVARCEDRSVKTNKSV